MVHGGGWAAAHSCVIPLDEEWTYRLLPCNASEQEMTKSLTVDREMLTVEQVHEITGVPISTLHDWAAKRERGLQAPGPHHIRLSNRHRRWARKDVDEWIESARI